MVGEAFVVGEVQPHEQPDALAAVGLLRRLSLELELHLPPEPESLPPTLDAVTRLLRRLFVSAEVENQIGLRHAKTYSGPDAPLSSSDSS